MEVYCDGSRIGLQSGKPVIGWAGVCNQGVIVSKSREGGSNVNAEMFAIRDTLQSLIAYRYRMLESCVENGDRIIKIVTDSKVSIQILNGMSVDPKSYDLNESENYRAAYEALGYVEKIKSKFGMDVQLEHIHGHQGHLGNVFADYVAVQASNSLAEKLGYR